MQNVKGKLSQRQLPPLSTDAIRRSNENRFSTRPSSPPRPAAELKVMYLCYFADPNSAEPPKGVICLRRGGFEIVQNPPRDPMYIY